MKSSVATEFDQLAGASDLSFTVGKRIAGNQVAFTLGSLCMLIVSLAFKMLARHEETRYNLGHRGVGIRKEHITKKAT